MNEINETFLELLEKISDAIIENESMLTELDRKIGDSDHGINMKRGFEAVKKEIDTYKDIPISDILTKCAMTLITNVGGASGPLYGTAFMKAGMELKGKSNEEVLQNEVLYEAFSAAVKGVKDRGKAEIGDKTMIDVLEPVMEEFGKFQNCKDKRQIMEHLEEVGREKLEYTKMIAAKKGRASYLGERSIGTEDPGACSSYIILKTIKDNLK
ncbi:dihydroxyacetone kinase subunit DhaL [Sebaldella sp. S0638]|uniref:dihydroxyacetone kinase subunit DhaL n=1 Tax=Sebaldella sp. S0638 TaxID=2957809 RepID=UPI00209DB47F|nr:dihydroxyacetone kinase subunit DhaL [Sebaldella sp. S0638]MCP1225965.1 dihydroxyacetone kinase subunit DhaL [Sebaldella sp. S0638]